MIGRRVGRFLIKGRLGQGGLATVWRAHDELLGRSVALKILDEKLATSPKARRRFLHEAQAAALLDHPGIVAVYDTGESDGLVYMALSLIDGETVSERAARSLLPFSEAVRIVSAAADALDHAHGRGVIHRDVTGRNIMVGQDGRVFVLDFGLALAVWESRVTTSETTMGTAAYMAPEVIRGSQADARSDLYGLGVVLYEALTGTYPFTGDQPQTLFYGALNLDPVSPSQRRPEISPALERVVLKAIARDPDARYQSAGEMLEELLALANDRRVEVSEASAPPVAAPHPAAGTSADRSGPAPSQPTPGSRPDPLYLAVLPFAPVESAPDADDACRELAGRLANTVSCALGNATGVRVVPPSASSLPDDPRAAARQWGANAFLSGTVRQAGSRLRVSYSVLDAWHGTQIAGDVVDGSALQMFDVEDALVASVSRSLGVRLDAGTKAPFSRPPDPAAHERYMQALNYLKRYDNEASVDGAIRLLEQLIVSEGDVAIYYAALARAFLHKPELTNQRVWQGRAAAACQRAQELDPDAPEVRLAIGNLHASVGQLDEALDDFRAALASRPDLLEGLIGLGRVHEAAGRRREAEEAFRNAVELRPEDWRGYSWLGWHYFNHGDYRRASEAWGRVVELTPDNVRGRRNLGSAFYRLDRFEEAAAAYRASIEIQPNTWAYTNLGTLLFYLGQRSEAVAAFRKATELDPLDPICWGNLGNACRWVPDSRSEEIPALDRAIVLMREQLERGPGDADTWARLAGWLANRGLQGDALSAIHQALQMAPEDPQCMVRAGHVYFQLGERGEALRWLREAVRRGHGVTPLRLSPELAPLREDPEFQRILEEGPRSPGIDHEPPVDKGGRDAAQG